MKRAASTGLLFVFLSSPLFGAEKGKLPQTDQRRAPTKTLDTRWTFPEISSRAQWETRAREIREHILVSCGLWPMPEKTPLQAKVFDRVERDGYTIEKVQFQTLPGFYLAGNLYRPLGQGAGPFPAILNPHGHWRKGRLEDQELGSIAARCINFAKQGMIAFSYDMVGYNDTAQVPHTFASDPTNLLWNVSLMGLQTWNSIRALEFLESLPDADAKRLACTGESGGGTQTFMLGAIDARLAAQAPIVMVSHSMQGGCLCENAPGLRLDYSNMEIAAAAAPRPQLLVAATGDWTRATMEIEGPSIEKIYRLFNAPEKLKYMVFDYNHNYNRTSREAVYEFFGRTLLNDRPGTDRAEAPYQKEPDEALRVWPENKPPSDALSETRLIASLIERGNAACESLRPKDRPSLEKFKQAMLPAWRHTLAVAVPEKGVIVESGAITKGEAYSTSELFIGRAGRGDRVPVTVIHPVRDDFTWIVVLVALEGRARFIDAQRELKGLAKEFVGRRYSVVLVDLFANTGRDHLTKYFSTYNRTDLQERVQDIVTTCAFAQAHSKGRKVLLAGTGDAGLWCLLAAPAAQAVVADYARFERDDARLLKDLFVPGIRRFGGFEGMASLAAPNPMLVHNVGSDFKPDWLTAAHTAAQSNQSLRVSAEILSDADVVEWVSTLRGRARAQ